MPMEKKDVDTPSNLWTRRSNSSKLNLSMSNTKPTSSKGSAFGSTSAASSPSTAFGLGSGAFASFGASGKTPKTPSGNFEASKASGDKSSDESSKEKRPAPRKSLSSVRQPPSTAESSQSYPLRHTWIFYYRPPTNKNSDYEKSIRPMCRISTLLDFWKVYTHLKRPSTLPTVSDYHFFKEGIRPVWEDEENKRGGKWTMRVKKGVADRYWENLLLAMIGDQFVEASEEVCGAVVSMRSGEDVFSIWTKNDGGRNVKIRETIKRELELPADTLLQWRSHDESITQKNAVDQARQQGGDKRRNTLNAKGEGGMTQQ